MNRSARVVIGIVLLLVGRSVSAQLVRMPAANATSAEAFSDIRGIRELPDGRILVSDYRDQRVVLVDLERGTVTARVTEGSGPQEARLPTALIPALGDSTVLIDMGNQRLLVLDGEGRVRRTIPGSQPGIMGLKGIDRTGVYYFSIPSWMERGRELPNDSVRIVRWNPRAGAQQTIAVIQGERMRSNIREPALTPRIPTVGYGSRDAWVVDGRGGVRIVRGGSYTVEVHLADEAPVIGPGYSYQTAKINQADRVAFVRRFMLTSPSSGKGPGGGLGFSPPASDQEIARLVLGTEFAERHPMFDAGSVLVESGGRLWVGLPAGSGQPVRYDLFDLAGRRVASLEFPAGRRVVALGNRSLYAIVEADDGLQHLERYSMPGERNGILPP